MTGYKLKQIGAALCLIATLLIGSASACTCSHHEETPQAHELSCHGSHHETTVNTSATGNSVEAGCVCFVNQPTPAVVSKSESNKSKTDKSISKSDQPVPAIEFGAAAAVQHVSLEFDRTLSYSNVLRSLLPARAPPRL